MIPLAQLLGGAGVQLSADAAQRMETYREILIDWNTRMDLTAVSDEDMAARHFLDSLWALDTDLIPQNARLIDVGTGAGFPGLPLAIARPDLRVTLLDAQEKRCKFLRHVLEQIGIQNAVVIQTRAELAGRDKALRGRFDLAVARAVAPSNVLCEYLLPLTRVGGRMVLWKGPALTGELQAAKKAAALTGGAYEKTLDMPGETSHVLAVFKKIKETSPQFPRQNGVPAKKPLGIE